jgi:uncharacterized Zn-finger protein
LFSDISGVTEKKTCAQSESEIGRQVDGHLTAEVSSLQCSVCERGFKNKARITKHLKLHQNNEINDKGLFQCEVCNKQFNMKCRFVAHKNIHTNLKPHKCT